MYGEENTVEPLSTDTPEIRVRTGCAVPNISIVYILTPEMKTPPY